MTRGIEDMLDLPHLDDILAKTAEPVTEQEDDLPAYVVDEDTQLALQSMTSEFQSNLPPVDEVDHSESLDKIYEETHKFANELMDLGFNVDQRGAATIFEKANMLFKTALDAKDAKLKGQLAARKLLLDERKLQLEEMKLRHDTGEQTTVQTDAVVIEDRNELIKRMREQAKSEKPS